MSPERDEPAPRADARRLLRQGPLLGRGPLSGPLAREIVRGLDPAMAERPAAEVLEAVRWEGLGLDPELTPAGDFLAWL